MPTIPLDPAHAALTELERTQIKLVQTERMLAVTTIQAAQLTIVEINRREAELRAAIDARLAANSADVAEAVDAAAALPG